jgi:hypothetical protein
MRIHAATGKSAANILHTTHIIKTLFSLLSTFMMKIESAPPTVRMQKSTGTFAQTAIVDYG